MVGWPTPLKNDGVKVSWDDDIPNIWKNKIHVPNQRPVLVVRSDMVDAPMLSWSFLFFCWHDTLDSLCFFPTFLDMFDSVYGCYGIFCLNSCTFRRPAPIFHCLTLSDTKHFRGPMAVFIWQLSPNQRHQQLAPRDGKGVQQHRELRGPPPSSSTPALRMDGVYWRYRGYIVGDICNLNLMYTGDYWDIRQWTYSSSLLKHKYGFQYMIWSYMIQFQSIFRYRRRERNHSFRFPVCF